MAGLGDNTIQSTYGDILNILKDGDPNSGILGSLKYVRDGKGNATPLSMSTSSVVVKGTLAVTDQINADSEITGTRIYSTNGIIGKESNLTSASVFLGTNHVDLKTGNDSILSARSTGEVRLKALSSAPSSGSSLGDLINQSGTLMVCVSV